MIIAFFSTMLFAGLVGKVAQDWQASQNLCPHAPSNNNANLYCGAMLFSLIGLAVSGLALIWAALVKMI